MSDTRSAALAIALLAWGCQHDAPSSAQPTREASMPQLTTTLRGPSSFPAGAPIKLTLTVEGPGKFCVYHTPFEGVRNAFLTVHRDDGAEVPYAGMMAKRAPPGPEHFVTLARGEKRAAEFDVREGYQLTRGAYRVRFEGGSISGLPASAELRITVE